MKNLKFLLPTLIFSAMMFNCKSDKKEIPVEEETTLKVTKPTNVIDIVTRAMEFQMQDTIPSGWNTFEYNNLANETHFFDL